jgi:hypothetical protein
VPYVDVHCHLLPGFDDGAARLEDSLAHARRLAADGVREVVCTPHIKRSEFPAVAMGEIAARTRAMERALADAGLRGRLHTGGELARPDALVLAPRDLALVAQGPPGGRWVLLECPFAGFDAAFADACRRLGRLGYGFVPRASRTRGGTGRRPPGDPASAAPRRRAPRRSASARWSARTGPRSSTSPGASWPAGSRTASHPTTGTPAAGIRRCGAGATLWCEAG